MGDENHLNRLRFISVVILFSFLNKRRKNDLYRLKIKYIGLWKCLPKTRIMPRIVPMLYSLRRFAFLFFECICTAVLQWKMNRSERQRSRWKWLEVVRCHLQTQWLPVCSAHIRALMSKLWSFWACKRHLVYNGLHIKQKSTLKPWKSDWKNLLSLRFSQQSLSFF